MKKYKVKLTKKKNPDMAYGGQIGFGLDVTPDSYTSGYVPSFEEMLNSTLKPVDRDAANVEAELGETVVADFDQDGVKEHLKVGGKKHSQGGTPLTLPENSFVFSDTPKLKMSAAEASIFGKSEKSKKKYTPAELAKQYDVNKYKAILDNPDADDISRRTAQMMISNYEKKLAQLALVQEAKKGFPTGVPEIAMPLLMSAIEEPVVSTDQMKYGGAVSKYAIGGPTDIDPYTGDKNATINPLTGEKSKTWNKSRYSKEQWEQIKNRLGYTGPDNNKAFQQFIYGKFPDLVNRFHSDKTGYGMPLAGTWNDGNLGVRWDRIVDAIEENQSTPKLPKLPSVFDLPEIAPPVEQRSQPVPAAKDNPPVPGDFQPAATAGSFDYLTPDKLTYMQGLRNRAGIKRYGPWEAPIEAVLPEATFYDPSRELASNAEQMNTQMMFNNQFSGPQSVAARNSQVSGRAAANAADILSRYNNMNVQTANQFSAENANILNQLQQAKAARANRLYQGNVVANQQYDNARREADTDLTKAAINAWNNRAMLGMINDTNPYYDIDPVTGRIDLTKAKGIESITGSPSAGSSQQPTYKSFYKMAKEQGMNDEDARKYAYEMFKGMKASYTDNNNDGYWDKVRTAMIPYTGLIGPQ